MNDDSIGCWGDDIVSLLQRKQFRPSRKHKARLCACGRMQQWGVNLWETHALVVNWTSGRLLLIIAHNMWY